MFDDNPILCAKDTEIYDTTLRDGSQGEGISFSLEDKIRILKELDKFGVSYVEGGWPGSNPKDVAFFNAAKSMKLRYAKLAAFGSTRYKNTTCEKDANIQALINAETPVVTLVAKSCSYQVELVLSTTKEENLAMIYDSVHYLKSFGKVVMLDLEHFFDAYVRDPEYALECCYHAVIAGVDALVLCDTNGGTLPWQIHSVTKEIVEKFGDKCKVGIHCHNDMEMAVANSLSAVEAGAMVVQGTMNGFGERTGNANLTTIIPTLAIKMNKDCMHVKENLKLLTSLSRLMDELANQPHVNSRPFVGSSAFAHKGGLHVAAVMKDENTYQHIDPTLVGNVKRILISELSGRGNILSKMEELGLLGNPSAVEKKEGTAKERSRQVLEQIKDLEHKGYTFEGAEASVELMIRRSMASYVSPFELIDFNVHIANSQASRTSAARGILFGNTSAQAVVRLNIIEGKQGESCSIRECLEVGEGNGPVDALNAALRKALLLFFPSLTALKLTDYKVRILDNESATRATTRVMISFMDVDSQSTWTTVSAHPNIIVASINALVDGFEYAMLTRQPECLLVGAEELAELKMQRQI